MWITGQHGTQQPSHEVPKLAASLIDPHNIPFYESQEMLGSFHNREFAFWRQFLAGSGPFTDYSRYGFVNVLKETLCGSLANVKCTYFMTNFVFLKQLTNVLFCFLFRHIVYVMISSQHITYTLYIKHCWGNSVLQHLLLLDAVINIIFSSTSRVQDIHSFN